MIWYKAWLESRWRFAAGMLLITAIAAMDIGQARLLMPRLGIPEDQFGQFVWKSYFTRIAFGWTLSALLLAAGGLVREQALGSYLFSLSLPVSRRRWLAVRTLLALGQSLVLALIPAAIVPIMAGLLGWSYSPWDAAKFSLLLFLTGLATFAVGILCSSLFQNEFASVAVGVGFVFACGMVANAVAPHSEYGAYMTGRQHMDSAWHLTKGWPWWGIAANAVAGIALLGIALRNLERRDF